ncbi:class I SAM-dependent methyltransferase [Candidatus Thorarchaeota archaeon]|nr:MAG: class I SAM-dependent methyltransferase [Candidatus Thorarchaeota archaeon]
MPDVYGMIMLDAAKGLDRQYTIERDDGHLDPDDVKTYITPYEKWSEREQSALKHVKSPVLDVGCGAGRVAVYLQEQGHEVIGIDMSPGAIEASRMMGLNEARLMSAEEMHFSDILFETVLFMGNNFGLLGTPEKTRHMLRALYDITTDDALVLAESVDAVKTENPRHLAYHQKNREEGRPPGIVTIRFLYRDEVSDWSKLWLALPEEMNSVAEEAGWFLAEQIGKNGPYIGLLRKR